MFGMIVRAIAGVLTDLAGDQLRDKTWGPVVHYVRRQFTSHTTARRVGLVASLLIAFVCSPLGVSQLHIHIGNPIFLAFLFCAAILISVTAIACEVTCWNESRFETDIAKASLRNRDEERGDRHADHCRHSCVVSDERR
jgi:hypothetical protein